MASSMFTNHKHLSQMRFRLGVTLEAVLISTLFLADLTVPPQALQAFGFHLIRDKLGSSNYSHGQQ